MGYQKRFLPSTDGLQGNEISSSVFSQLRRMMLKSSWVKKKKLRCNLFVGYK